MSGSHLLLCLKYTAQFPDNSVGCCVFLCSVLQYQSGEKWRDINKTWRNRKWSLRALTLFNFSGALPCVRPPYLSLLIYNGRQSISVRLLQLICVCARQLQSASPSLTEHTGLTMGETDPWIMDTWIHTQLRAFWVSEEARVFVQVVHLGWIFLI